MPLRRLELRLLRRRLCAQIRRFSRLRTQIRRPSDLRLFALKAASPPPASLLRYTVEFAREEGGIKSPQRGVRPQLGKFFDRLRWEEL